MMSHGAKTQAAHPGQTIFPSDAQKIEKK